MRRQLLLKDGEFLIGGRLERVDVRICGSTIAALDTRLEEASGDVVVPLEGLCVVPGLINSHDHLEFNLFPRLGSPPYKNYVEWSEDIQKNDQPLIRQILRVPLRQRLLWGAFKNIFSGVTTVVHHNPYFWQFRIGFLPLEVYHPYQWIHSLRLEKRDLSNLLTTNKSIRFIHLAEGTDSIARRELEELKQMNGLSADTILIHGVGLQDKDIHTMRNAGSGLVWCPSSNEYLFGATAPVEKMIGGIKVALGTDSTLTGSESLFEEMRVAKSLKGLNAKSIFDLVTFSPMKMLRLKNREIGLNATADFLMFQKTQADPFQTILNLTSSSLSVLWKRGLPIFGDRSFRRYVPQVSRKVSMLRMGEKEKFVIGDFPRLVKQIRSVLPDTDLPLLHLD